MFFKKKPKAPLPAPVEDTSSESPENHRRNYRRDQLSQETFEFVVRDSTGTEFQGEFLDASISGAAARFTLSNEPGLQLGDVVEVCIGALNHERRVETPARVVYVEPGGDQHWRYAFEFTSPGNLYSQMDEFHAQIFNRRKDRRIQIPPEQAIRAKLKWGQNSLDCKLYDLSIGGMSTVLTDDKAQRLDGIERLRVTIELNHGEAPIEGAATIGHREQLPGRMLFGIQFKLDGENGFRAHQATLDRFISARRVVIERWERAIRSA